MMRTSSQVGLPIRVASRRLARVLRWGLPAAALAVAGGAGQEAPPAALHDVYVDDSFESRDALSRAKVLARAGRWEEAAAMLQQTVDRFGTMLTPAEGDVYVTVRRQVARLVSGWPAEGVAAWRRLYETPAAQALESEAADQDLGRRVARWEAYFSSRAAARQTDRLAQQALEAGRLALARRLYETALQFHPDRADFEPQWRAKLALICGMQGQMDLAARLLEMHAAASPARIRWMGQDRAVTDVLAEIPSAFASMQVTAACATDWPMLGADPGRNAVASCEVDDPGLLWRFAENATPSGNTMLERGADAEALRAPIIERGRLLSQHPIIAGSVLVTQHGAEITALHLRSGTRAWRAAAAEPSGPDAGDGGPILEAPCADNGRVYAVLPEARLSAEGLDTAETGTSLVCLDLSDGRELWRRRPQAYGGEHADVLFDASPLVRRDQVFVVGRRRRAFGFEDCYLYRLRAADGAFLSRAHLGSASTGSFGYRRATFSIPSAEADVVYVGTHLGTIAAVSEDTGAVVWLQVYPQAPGRTRGGRPTASEALPWQFSPALCWEDRLVALPTDSDDLLVLDQATGRLVQRIPRERLGGAESLLGIVDGWVITAGASVTATELATQSTIWSTRLPEDAPLFGRGVVLRDRVLAPTPRFLCSFRLSDGARTDRAWDSEGEGGNLVPLPDMLLVAGDGRLSAYLRKEDIWNSLRERMAAAPEDPEPALDFAEAALRDGEPDEAEAILAEAFARADRRSESLDPAFRRRIHDTVMTFAERAKSGGRLTSERLDRFFDWASPWAVDRDMHVEQRLRFAQWYESLGGIDRAVRLYQQILMDRSLRDVDVEPPGAWPQPASALAERHIARLLQTHGRRSYAAFEEQAARNLDAALAADDLALLDRVVETFPNSETAPRALTAAGEMLLASGRPQEAAHRYIEAYYRYPDALNRPELIRDIADALQQAGQRTAAYGWLTKGSREFPTALIEAGDRRTTLAELRVALADARLALEPRRAELAVPLRAGYAIDFEEEPVLLSSGSELHPAADASGFFVHVAGEVRRFDAATGTPSWSVPCRVTGHPRILLATTDLAVIATPHEVLGVDSTGQRRWSVGRPPPELQDPGRDWEGLPTFTHFTLHSGRLLCVRDDGQATCLHVQDGRILWEQVLRPAPGRDLSSSDDWITYTAQDNRRPGLFRVNWTAAGDVRGAAIDDLGPILRTLTTFDGQVLVASAEKVGAFDPATGDCRWVIAPGGRIRDSALLTDFDGLYLTVDGRTLTKVSLNDGHELWRSAPVTQRGDEGLSVMLQDGNLIVSDTRGITALDGLTGQILWKGITPERPNLVFRGVSRAYVAAIDARHPSDETPTRALFYDHRNASGLLPREGGVLELKDAGEITAAALADHALIIQSGKTIRGWTDTSIGP